jgi:hypothetical protein
MEPVRLIYLLQQNNYMPNEVPNFEKKSRDEVIESLSLQGCKIEGIAEKLGAWREEQYATMPAGKEGVATQNEHLLDYAELFHEAASRSEQYKDELIDQYYDMLLAAQEAVMYANYEGSQEFYDKITERIEYARKTYY